MTMQIKDNFVYRGKKAEAIAISPKFEFTPSNNFGIETAAWGTANYRGFWCDYGLDEKILVKNLSVFAKDRNYTPINNIYAEEISTFVNMFKEINKGAKVKRKYIDMFPMIYRDINYLYEYTGKIVLGIEPQNESGAERYLKVCELQYEKGLLLSEREITELWKAACVKENGQPEDYWWELECNSYFQLINYDFIGIEFSRSGS